MIQIVREVLYTYLSIDISSDYILTILTAFYVVGIVVIILRIATTLGYHSSYSLFLMSAKELKSLRELKETPSRLLNKIIKEYIRSAEKGIHGLNTEAIVNKHVSKLRLFFLRYRTLEDFISQFEISIVLIGILLAAFLDFKDIFAVSAIAMFCLMRVIALIFNFTTAREALEAEITVYVEREVGQYYTTNVATSIQMLKLEMKNIVNEQSKILSNAIGKLCNDIPEILKSSAPISEWSTKISEASVLQDSLNIGIKEINSAASRLNSSMALLDKTFAAQNDYLIQYQEAVHTEISELSKVSEKLEPSYVSIQSNLDYIKQNQTILEKSLQSYELALENMTAKLGQGFGSIISCNMETAYNNLNAGIIENISKIISSNNEFYVRLQSLFSELSEQSRNEANAIVSLKEQMDIHFDELKDKTL